jgi:hypothetical protein
MSTKRIWEVLAAALVAYALAASLAWGGTQATSSTTVATIITRAQQDINDASGNFFTSAESIRWINEAVEIIASQSRCLETSENATLLNGQMAYTISTSHYDIESVLYDSGLSTDPQRYSFLNKVDIRDLHLLSKEKGRPTYWWEWNDNLHVWPVPGSGQNATTVQAFMIEKPTAITSTSDTIPTPYYMDHLILLYMKARYYEKGERPATANYYRSLFEQRMAFYRGEVRQNLVEPKEDAQ